LVETSVIVIIAYIAVALAGAFLILKFTKDKTRKISNLRLFVQGVALVGVFMGLLVGPFGNPLTAPLGNAPRQNLLGANFFGSQFPDGLSVPMLACFYPSGRTVTCPIWQLQAYIFPFWDSGVRGYLVYYVTDGLEKLAIVVGLVVLMSVVLGRFFCGWLCPFGLYMDILTRLRKATGKRHLSFGQKGSAKLRQFSYIIIAVFLILSVIFGSQAIFGAQIVPGTNVGGPQGTEAGITGAINEPFCLVCPVRPLCTLAEIGVNYASLGLSGMRYNYVFGIDLGSSWPLWLIGGFYVSVVNLVILAIVTILSIAYRRFWCRICPMGAISGFFSTFKPFKQVALTKLEKNEQTCTKCGVCKRVCPTQATDMYEKKGGDVTESKCMLCFRCVEMCPEKDTLKIKMAGKTVFASRNWLESQKTDLEKAEEKYGFD
jgi:ferredoxin-type protein NapH